MEKSKWSNSFYTAKLSAKICNERYKRHIPGSLKELVGKRLGCLCPNPDNCHGNVLIELVHELFPSESEMRGYILCNQYLSFKGQKFPVVKLLCSQYQNARWDIYQCSSDVWVGKGYCFGRKICGQEYPGSERFCKDFQASENPCKLKCATEHRGLCILDVSLPM